jgi:hypothetical protein
MWRSFFLAVGAYVCLLGVQSLAVERAVLKADVASRTGLRQEIVPPDWAPWSLIGSGAVVAIYSFTIPRRVAA